MSISRFHVPFHDPRLFPDPGLRQRPAIFTEHAHTSLLGVYLPRAEIVTSKIKKRGGRKPNKRRYEDVSSTRTKRDEKKEAFVGTKRSRC